MMLCGVDDEVVADTPSSGVKEIFMGTLQQERCVVWWLDDLLFFICCRSGLLFKSSSDAGLDTERPKSAEPLQNDTVNGTISTLCVCVCVCVCVRVHACVCACM